MLEGNVYQSKKTAPVIDSLIEAIDTGATASTVAPSYNIYLSPELAQIIDQSSKISASMNDEFVSTEHLFLSFFEVPSSAKDILTKFKIDKDRVEMLVRELKQDSVATPQATPKNRNLIKSIMKKISTMIVTFLVTVALKQIATLVATNTAKKQTEKSKNQLAQLLSLVGVPQDGLRMIRGLT